MSTPPISPIVAAVVPDLPLTPEVRAAYEDLYDKYEDAIEITRDPGVHEALLGSQLNVENVLDKDNLYRIEENTKLYDALLGQIKTTNTEVQDLKAQISTISSDVSTFGDILGAITKVLSLVPGA